MQRQTSLAARHVALVSAVEVALLRSGRRAGSRRCPSCGGASAGSSAGGSGGAPCRAPRRADRGGRRRRAPAAGSLLRDRRQARRRSADGLAPPVSTGSESVQLRSVSRASFGLGASASRSASCGDTSSVATVAGLACSRAWSAVSTSLPDRQHLDVLQEHLAWSARRPGRAGRRVTRRRRDRRDE